MTKTKVKQRIFTDVHGAELIVRHRKSAVFFERVADIEKPNGIAAAYKVGSRIHNDHVDFVDKKELTAKYEFSQEKFQEFYAHCLQIANEAWASFQPKEADSWGSDYDDYYDSEFDNNGSLGIGQHSLHLVGPYAQPKSNGEVVRLIKFNKRKFESFVFDLVKRGGVSV